MKKNILFIFILVILLMGCTQELTEENIPNAYNIKNETPMVMNPVITIDSQENLISTLKQVKDNDTIYIKSGEYIIHEPIALSSIKNLTIEGMDNVWIKGNKVDFQIIKLIDCINIRIKNINACHIPPQGEKVTGFDKRSGSVIDLENCSDIELINCELEGCGVYGVYAKNSDALLLNSCNLHHNSSHAIFSESFKKSTITIENNTITHNASLYDIDDNTTIVDDGSNHITNNNKGGYEKR